MFLLGGVGGGGHHLFLFVNEVRKFIALPPILDLAVLTYIYIGIMNIHIDAMSC